MSTIPLPTSLDTIYELGMQWITKATGGKVFDYEPVDIRDPSEFLAKCTEYEEPHDPSSQRIIHFWTITRTSVSREMQDLVTDIRRHKFTIRGYYGDGQPDCERTFKDKVEAFDTEFRSHRTVPTAVSGKATICFPPQIELEETGMPFGEEMLCWCEISWEVEEEVTCN